MILNGKKVRDEYLEKAKEKIQKENIKATLAVIQIGNNEASNIYIKNKEKYCSYVGIGFKLFKYSEKVEEQEIVNLVQKLNNDESITGILIQSPVPNHINFDYVSGLIKSSKDVDGFTKDNIYNLYLGKDTLMPCTVKGIIKLLEYYDIPVGGKDILIIGRGNIVGHPLSLALLNKDATVTVAHSKTKDLKEKCLKADIIISATGINNLITSDMVNNNLAIIDVGITRVNGKIKGDVDYENVQNKCQNITPNPGGVGPMTIAMLIDNVLTAYERRK